MRRRAHPTIGAAAVPAGGCAAAGGNLPRQHRGADRGRLHARRSARPGPRRPTTRRRSASGSAKQLTLIGTMDGSPVGFASLKAPDVIDMLYVHPAAGGNGVGDHAGRCAGKARGRARRRQADGRVSDSAHRFLQQARLRAAAAQHRAARRRMARQHHDGKAAGREGDACQARSRSTGSNISIAYRRAICALLRLSADLRTCESLIAGIAVASDGCCACRTIISGERHGPRTPLSVRHHAARRRADQRRRLHAARQARDRAACSTSSASTMSRAAIRAPIRPTPSCSAKDRKLDTHLHRLRHDAAARPLDLERSGPRGAARRQGRRHLLRRQVLGLSRARRAGDHATRKTSPRSATACGPPRRKAARCCSTASTSSTATRPIRPTRSPAPRPPMRRARAGWCCATPTAARCRTRSKRSSARWSSTSPATTSASMPITTPSRRWRIRSPRCAPARARSRARSTGSASAAATPTWSRSSRR